MRGQISLVSALVVFVMSIGAASATSDGGFNITINDGSENASCRGGKAASSARQDDGAPGRGSETSFVAHIAPGFYHQVGVAPFVGPGNNVSSESCNHTAPRPNN